MKTVIDIRRELHIIPETGFDLPKTTAYIGSQLGSLGLETISPFESCLAVYFDFSKEHTIAIRADIDALPITEKSDKEYMSAHAGYMHACGHDGHAAMLLSLAEKLSKRKQCSNNVLLIFQPAEESGAGGKMLAESGLLQEYGVDAAVALHLWPGIAKGLAYTSAGPFMAGSREFDVEFIGSSAHVSKKEEGRDVVLAVSEFVSRINRMNICDAVIHVGMISGGTVRNAVADVASASGTMRWFKDTREQEIAGIICSAAAEACIFAGCSFDVKYSSGYPVLYNSRMLVKAAKKALKESLYTAGERCFGSDDFAFLAALVPSLYIKLGVGDAPPLHSPIFDFDESVLEKGVEILAELADIDLSCFEESL